MSHFLIGAGLGAGTTYIAWRVSGSLLVAAIAGALTLAGAWIGGEIADRTNVPPSQRRP